jgi:hypothetical protein
MECRRGTWRMPRRPEHMTNLLPIPPCEQACERRRRQSVSRENTGDRVVDIDAYRYSPLVRRIADRLMEIPEFDLRALAVLLDIMHDGL